MTHWTPCAYTLGEGPCLTAVERGAAVRSAAIGLDETRWARFTPRAAQLGLRGVVSFPLRSDGTTRQVVGSLNLYGRTAKGVLETDEAVMERTLTALTSRVNSARALAVADANTAILIAAVRGRRLSERPTPPVVNDARG